MRPESRAAERGRLGVARHEWCVSRPWPQAFELLCDLEDERVSAVGRDDLHR